MFTEKLKEATLYNHQQTEKILVAKMRNMVSKQDYVALLSDFYAYFGGIECQIAHFIDTSNLADYLERRKTAAIADDINALGGTVPLKAEGNNLPKIDNHLQAFGALYVIEGSTLGGEIISKMVKQHLQIDDNSGLSFFNSYGVETHQMWAKFKLILNDIANTPLDEDTIIQAANETFVKFKNWLEK